MNPRFITFTPPRGLEPRGDDRLHFFEPDDPFADTLSLLLAPSGDDYLATVLWAGAPVLAVQAGSANSHKEGDRWVDYDHELPIYSTSYLRIQQAYFLHLIGEYSEDDFETVRDDEAADMGELGGDGRALIDFVGDVAWAMYDAVAEDDVPLPVSPEQMGWIR